MKNLILVSILILTSGLFSQAQTVRYFEFTTDCGHGNWQDTTFIASTSNQILIDSVLANLDRPLNERKFINGPIDYGNGGHNHNATHWFLWHFIPNQWNLVELAAEVCDGCPYTDLDSDTAYWVETIGYHCPWSGQPVREVLIPTGVNEQNLENEILIFPNPFSAQLSIDFSSNHLFSHCIISDILGREITRLNALKKEKLIWDSNDLTEGVYVVSVVGESEIHSFKVVKQ